MNKIQSANDAVFALVSATFPAASPVRNPAAPLATKAKSGAVATYVAQHDDRTPKVLRWLSGHSYDLEATPRLIFAYLGSEPDRRAAETAAVELLKTALAADVTLGGGVEYAEVEPPEETDADTLEWAAGGLIVPVRLLFNAPTKAG